MSFQVHGKDLLGRIGTIKTKSGAFATPHMFPVLDPHHRILGREFFDRVGIHAVMTNAYLLKRGLQGLEGQAVGGDMEALQGRKAETDRPRRERGSKA